MKDQNGSLVNSFVKTIEQSLMRRLRENGWPYVELTVQRRMPPGQFDLANYAIYGNLTMALGITIDMERFELARQAEEWTQTLAKHGITVTAPDAPKVPPSHSDAVAPRLIAVSNSYSYTAPGSTSKANTAIAHLVLTYIRMLKAFTPSISNRQIEIVVPYLQQRRLYVRPILAADEEFKGITIATANSFMGWEREFVFADFTAAENLSGKVGFVADKHRLTVKVTRQSQFLTCVADIRCAVVKAEEPVVTEDGKEPAKVNLEDLQLEADKKYKLETLKNVFEYFVKVGRVVYEDAHLITDPIMVQQVISDDAETMSKNRAALREQVLSRREEAAQE
jgi:hypothetical protein